MKVCKEFTFDAAHFLVNYKGKCENLHGHTYRLRVTIEGPLKENGLVMDFVAIKEIVKRKVIDRLDHTNLNDTIEQTSAENIAMWIWDEIKPEIPDLCEVRVWETADSFAIYEGPEA